MPSSASPVTDDSQNAHDLPHWQDLVRERFVALDIRPGAATTFGGSVSSRTVGPLAVSRVRSVAQTFRRTRGLISRYGEQALQVGMVRSGTALLEQDGRSCPIGPGEFAIYDTSRPFTWTMAAEWTMDVFTWSMPVIDLGGERTRLVTAQVLGDGATAQVARAALVQLSTTCPDVTGAEGIHLASRVADLILSAAAFASSAAPGEVGVRAVLDHIELHLSDPELSPESVGRAFNVSVRNLHRQFADQPRSLSRWIRFRRLEHARAALTAEPNRPVAVVAARYCFFEPTVFARAFRDEYGVSPREYRRSGSG